MSLVLLHPKCDVASATLTTLDVVLVHGLDASLGQEGAIKAWTADDGTVWPRDVLPRYLPNARVFCYQHAGSVTATTNVAGFQAHALRLLRLLEAQRRYRFDQAPRPILFIGHSLGGLIIKQALILAFPRSQFRSLAEETCGIAFFATPHRVAPHDKDGTLLTTRLIGAVGQPGSTPSPSERAALPPQEQPSADGKRAFQELAGNLSNLAHISHDFVALREWQDFKIPIVNFLEQDKMPSLDGLVVTPAEAALTGTDTLSLPGNHLTVCQFREDQWEQTPFVRVRCMLKRMVLSFPLPPGTVPDRLIESSPPFLPEFVCVEF